MIDAARVRQTIATLPADADALDAELKEAAANDAPPAVKPPEAAPRPPGR